MSCSPFWKGLKQTKCTLSLYKFLFLYASCSLPLPQFLWSFWFYKTSFSRGLWRKAAGRWLLWEALPHTQCTHCRPSFCAFGGKSETPVNTVFYGFSFHSCSPFAVAWILWKHRAPKSSSLHCSCNTTPSFLLCKGNRTREAILAANSWACGVTFTGRDSMLCLFYVALCVELCFAP